MSRWANHIPKCDCGTIATIKDSAGCPVCAVCAVVVPRVMKEHDDHVLKVRRKQQEQITLERAEYQKEYAELHPRMV